MAPILLSRCRYCARLSYKWVAGLRYSNDPGELREGEVKKRSVKWTGLTSHASLMTRRQK